jgi:hypothetical protein
LRAGSPAKNQEPQSGAIKRNQAQSSAIKRNQARSSAIKRDQARSSAMDDNARPEKPRVVVCANRLGSSIKRQDVHGIKVRRHADPGKHAFEGGERRSDRGARCVGACRFVGSAQSG